VADAIPAPARAPARALVAVMVALACVPLVVAAVLTVAEGWVPISDDAVAATITHEVFSPDPPLLGMRSSAGDGTGNHPGPMLFWVLAPLEAVSGGAPWSFPVSVAVLAVTCLVAIAWASGRTAGGGAVVGAMAVTTVMAWSLGRQVLVDPWNPHAALLPFLASLFLVWAVAAGWSWGLPLVALGLSFVAQAHLVYGPMAAVLLVASVLVVARGPRPWPPILTAAGVLVAAWAFPFLEQLTGDPGNVTILREAADTEGDAAVGWAWSLRTVARTVGLPPSFAVPARGTDRFDPTTSVLAVVTAVAVVVGVVALGVAAWRRRDRVAAAAALVAVLGLALAALVLATLPTYLGLGVPQWRYLFMWPLGAFTWFALGLLLVRAASARAAGARVAQVVVGASAVALVAAAIAIPFTRSPGPGELPVQDAIRELGPELAAAVDGLGPVRVDAYGPPEIDRYGFFQELRRRGVDVRVRPGDEYLGEWHPGDPGLPVLVVVGGADRGGPAGGELLTTWDRVRPEDRLAVDASRDELVRRLTDPDLLTDEGAGALADPRDEQARALADVLLGDGDVEALVNDGLVVAGYEREWFRPESEDGSLGLLGAWARARDALEGRHLRVYLVPATAPATEGSA
jgi:hypothetical protein